MEYIKLVHVFKEKNVIKVLFLVFMFHASKEGLWIISW